MSKKQPLLPAVDVIDFKYGSAPSLNDYWHTRKDTMDKPSVESLQTVGDVVLRMVENMQQSNFNAQCSLSMGC